MIAGAVEHRDRDGFVVVGEWRGRKGKPGVVVMMRHADQRHALRKAELRARIFGVRVIWSRRRPSKPAASVVRSSFRLCGDSSSTERSSVPASAG